MLEEIKKQIEYYIDNKRLVSCQTININNYWKILTIHNFLSKLLARFR